MQKDTLGIVLALVLGAVTFALYLIDKSGRNTPAITIGVLLLIAALSLGLVYMVPWIWAPQQVATKAWRVCLSTALVLLAVGRFGIWVWPSTSTPPLSSAKVPSEVPREVSSEIGQAIMARDAAQLRLNKIRADLHKTPVTFDATGNQTTGATFRMIVYPANSSLKETILFLCAAINQFVIERLENGPPYVRDAGDSPVVRAYESETIRQYKSSFGNAVNEMHDKLAEQGLRDPAFDELYENPPTTHGIRVVADRMQELAEDLPNEAAERLPTQLAQEEPFTKHIEHPTGSLQFDKPQVTAENNTIAAGKQFGMNFRSRNNSPERVELSPAGCTQGSQAPFGEPDTVDDVGRCCGLHAGAGGRIDRPQPCVHREKLSALHFLGADQQEHPPVVRREGVTIGRRRRNRDARRDQGRARPREGRVLQGLRRAGRRRNEVQQAEHQGQGGLFRRRLRLVRRSGAALPSGEEGVGAFHGRRPQPPHGHALPEVQGLAVLRAAPPGGCLKRRNDEDEEYDSGRQDRRGGRREAGEEARRQAVAA
jgi:hypothetical protein